MTTLRTPAHRARDLGRHLARCAAAAGAAGTAVGSTAHAEAVPFDPPGGLPIVIESACGFGCFDLDLDGDEEGDYDFYWSGSYGGAFSMFEEFVPEVGYNRHASVRREGSFIELLRFEENATIDEDAFAGFTNFGLSSHFDVIGDQFNAPYTPFRDAPGFIGLALRKPGGSLFGYLEVVVNESATELRILGGAVESELDTPIVTSAPEPGALAALATAGGALAALATAGGALAALRRRRSRR